MKNFLLQHKEFLIGIMLTISLLWPLVWAPFFKHHDDVQVIRLYEMDKCIKDLQIPCRWVPDLGGLYGYPLFNYYAPLPYYLGELIYLITNNLILSVKMMFTISFVGAYIFMYLLAAKFWGKLGGSLSGIFYSLAPYHAVDFYVRGAMGEMWALMLFPAILWALTKLEEKANIANLLLSAVFIAVLATSHNLSAFIFLPIIIIWVILLLIKRKQIKFVWVSLLSLVLGLILSSFYFLPMIVEKNLVHVDTTTFGYFGYTEHFKGFKKLFLDRSWGWGSSIREVPGGEKEKVSFQIGWVHLLGWTLALFTAKILMFKNRWISQVILISSFIAAFSIVLIHPRSLLLWNLIPPLKYLQFPWRFLLIVIFSISFMAGSLFVVLKDEMWQKRIWILLTILVVAFNFYYFRPEKFIQTNAQELLSGQNWDRQIKRSIYDFLPTSAKEPPAELATSRYEILTGDTTIFDFKEGSNWIKFKADVKTHSIIRLSQYYFPNFKILVDGEEIVFDYKNNNLGLMTFILGTGQHVVEARLYDTPIRTLANFMTILGFVLTTLLLLIQFPRVRKWILYYRRRID